VFNYFKAEDKTPKPAGTEGPSPDIPLKNGLYDIEALGAKLAEVKKKVLIEIIKSSLPSAAADASLFKLYKAFLSQDFSSGPFSDHENVKIVAEDKIKYETVVSVMDAARGLRTPEGSVTMFPNVSIAGGIIQ
jgi:hypothetical protein